MGPGATEGASEGLGPSGAPEVIPDRILASLPEEVRQCVNKHEVIAFANSRTDEQLMEFMGFYPDEREDLRLLMTDPISFAEQMDSSRPQGRINWRFGHLRHWDMTSPLGPSFEVTPQFFAMHALKVRERMVKTQAEAPTRARSQAPFSAFGGDEGRGLGPLPAAPLYPRA